MKIAKVCFTGPRKIDRSQSIIIAKYLTPYINLFCDRYDKSEFHVGDAHGVDECIKNLLFSMRLVPTIHIVENKSDKTSYAKRSMEMVDSCSDCHKSMIFGFPNKNCPDKITLKDPFCGSGSGTWATLAYAKSKNIFQLNISPLSSIELPSWINI